MPATVSRWPSAAERRATRAYGRRRTPTATMGDAAPMPRLFDPLTLRDLTLRNRVAMSPMCTYACEARDGRASDWHLQHLASRATGGVGMVLSEATAVEPRGRISAQDLGLWDDGHVEALRRVARAVQSQGAAFGVQLAHAGRKAGTRRPWEPPHPDPGQADTGRDGTGQHRRDRDGAGLNGADWEPVGPTDDRFSDATHQPRPLDDAGLAEVVGAFAAAAARADAAGVDVIELHAAHGYLLHTFLSPLVNTRSDRYGGDEPRRCQLLLDVVGEVRAVWPTAKPLLVRLSASDWAPGGWDADATVRLARRLADLGVDLVDCSSGGAVPGARVVPHPNYQVSFAERVRREAGVASGAVGQIADPRQADAIVAEGRADVVLLGKALLRDPYWPVRAAESLGVPAPWPPHYAWALA
jgi:2,4-dienoyl-CoA reductase-like NADH-dependent reductase (Old Yellow Enzyme family)